MFIGWVGPRGIVAAGIASLFGLKLANQGVPGAEYITPLVFMIVLGTVLLNATTARLFAKIVKVFLVKSEGILIVGASKFSRLIGKYLMDNDRHVVLIDSNQMNIGQAKEMGLEAIVTNIYSDTLTDNIELNDVGFLLAMTGNTDINKYALDKYGKQFGEHGSFRVITTTEKNNAKNYPEEGLFSRVNDYTSLNAVAEKYPVIREVNVDDAEAFNRFIERVVAEDDSIPLFLKDPNGELSVLPSDSKSITKVAKGSQLVYMGKGIDMEA